MKHCCILLLSVAIFCMTACNGGQPRAEENETLSGLHIEKQMQNPPGKDTIKLSKVTGSPEFPDARLRITLPREETVSKTGKHTFTFKVDNFPLGEQTSDANSKQCANSAQGQHIHFIMDNGPYAALYVPEYEATLDKGNHVILAFLSRSYHESVKTKDAYILKQVNAGGADAEKADLSGPLLFYSRPKGTYTGSDTKKILLDFFVVNTELSKNGHRVKATINGTDFILDEWVPYFVEGLPMGKNRFRIRLIDAEGRTVPGPFNDSGERVVMLEEQEARGE